MTEETAQQLQTSSFQEINWKRVGIITLGAVIILGILIALWWFFLKVSAPSSKPPTKISTPSASVGTKKFVMTHEITIGLPASISNSSSVYGIRIKPKSNQKSFLPQAIAAEEEKYPAIFYTRDSTKTLYEQNLLTGKETEILKEDLYIRQINFFEHTQIVTYMVMPEESKTKFVQKGPLKATFLNKNEKTTLDENAYNDKPALSPDGQSLAFVVDNLGNKDGDGYPLAIYSFNTKDKKVLHPNEVLKTKGLSGTGPPESMIWSKDSKSLYITLDVGYKEEGGIHHGVSFPIFRLALDGQLKQITEQSKYMYSKLSLNKEGNKLFFVKELIIEGPKNSRGHSRGEFGFIDLGSGKETVFKNVSWIRSYISSNDEVMILRGFDDESGPFLVELNISSGESKKLISLGPKAVANGLGPLGWNGDLENLVVAVSVSFPEPGVGSYRFGNFNLKTQELSIIRDITMNAQDFNY